VNALFMIIHNGNIRRALLSSPLTMDSLTCILVLKIGTFTYLKSLLLPHSYVILSLYIYIYIERERERERESRLLLISLLEGKQ
jgi:hypothetical protein